MQLRISKKFIPLLIPASLLTYFLYINIFRSDTNFSNLENDQIFDNLVDDKKTNNQTPIKPFKLRSVGPNNESSTFNSIKALTRNPFSDMGSPQGEVGVNLPNNYKFTGIAQVGERKGVLVSTPTGIEVFYVGQQISKDFKVLMIDSKKAEVILTNGLNNALVKLERD